MQAGFDDGGAPDTEARLLWATCGGVRVASAYVPNGRALDNDHYTYKLGWLARLRAHLDVHDDPGGAVAVCGDFNIAPTDADVWDPAAFEGATHVSEPERAALAELETWGLRRRLPHAAARGRALLVVGLPGGDFHKRQGMRIDLVMASAGGRPRHVRGHRPQRAQGAGTVRPRARHHRLRGLTLQLG